MEFSELLKRRRSIRVFQDKPVEKEKIKAIVKSGLKSPSARGQKPWEFIVVSDRNALKRLSETRSGATEFLSDAPLGIVLIAKESASDMWIEDLSIAAIIMQLSAEALDLGSCWMQIRGRPHNDTVSASEYVKGILAIPENYHVECMLGIGYKGEVKKPHLDKDLLFEKVHYEKYGK